ncbi:MAG TPA: hypothetical protein VFQ65_05725 [Kofleriaceae bacterium]|nr:hypothetical protein [Kofleriaceae bacterium]
MIAVWGTAWTAVVVTHHAAPVSLAAAFDFVVTANVALWWCARREVPRWAFGVTLALGLVFARLAIAGAHGGGLAIVVAGGALEVALVAAVAIRFRRARAAYRRARTRGEDGFAALIAALEAARMPRVVANVVATEVYLFAMAVRGWHRSETAARAFTVHRTNGLALYAGVFGFLIISETPCVHLVLAHVVGSVAAWIATAASVYSLFWLAGYTNAVRHGGVLVTAGELELRIGVRWRGRVARSAIAAVEACEAAPEDALDCSVLGANTVVRFTHPLAIEGLFGRRYETAAVALSIDDRAAFQLALADPLTTA